MSQFAIRPLDTGTWDAFARLCEKYNGCGFGGCWCTWFHLAVHGVQGAAARSAEQGSGADESGRILKERLVREGKAHAALVFDGEEAVGWCEFGSPAELPGIAHKREYEAGLVSWPDYRLTCFFVDRAYRRKGVAAAALDGAVDLIAAAGGGLVEGYPQDTAGKKISSSFLYNGTRTMFEKAGFDYERPKGKNHCVMRKVVPATLGQ
jgi:GNAT superfamily N-acetyltransferase